MTGSLRHMAHVVIIRIYLRIRTAIFSQMMFPLCLHMVIYTLAILLYLLGRILVLLQSLIGINLGGIQHTGSIVRLDGLRGLARNGSPSTCPLYWIGTIAMTTGIALFWLVEHEVIKGLEDYYKVMLQSAEQT